MKKSYQFIAVMSGLLLLAFVMSAAAEEDEEDVFQPPTPQQELAERQDALAQIDQLAEQMIKTINHIPALTLDTPQTPRGYGETGKLLIKAFIQLNNYTENTATLHGGGPLVAQIQAVYAQLQPVATSLMNASATNAFVIAKRNATGTLTQEDLQIIATLNAMVITDIGIFQGFANQLPVVSLPKPS